MTEYYQIEDMEKVIHTYKTKAGFIRGVKSMGKLYNVRIRYLWKARTWLAFCVTEDRCSTAGWQGIIHGRYNGEECGWMYQCRGGFDWDCARV